MIVKLREDYSEIYTEGFGVRVIIDFISWETNFEVMRA